MTPADCPLCHAIGGELIHETPQWRVVRATDMLPDYPAVYRVIWQAHVREWSDLRPAERQVAMEAVTAVETAVRIALRPTKVNLATLGNVTPHLHWHVVARFESDRHWPRPVWDVPLREGDAAAQAQLQAALPALDALVRVAVQGGEPAQQLAAALLTLSA